MFSVIFVISIFTDCPHIAKCCFAIFGKRVNFHTKKCCIKEKIFGVAFKLQKQRALDGNISICLVTLQNTTEAGNL